MWDYHPENYGTNKKVASYRNSKDIEVLYVLENDKDGHFSFPLFPFITVCTVSLEEEKNFSRETFTDSEEEIYEKRLRVACAIIETDYKEQPVVKTHDFI